MKLKTLILTATFILIVAVCVQIYQFVSQQSVPNRVGQPIAGNIDADLVHQIKIVEQDKQVTLKRVEKDGQGWIVSEQQNFAADQWEISTLLAELQTRSVGHFVTDKPEKISALELRLPNEQKEKASNAPSGKQLKLLDKDQKVLLHLVVGKDRTSLSANGMPRFGGQYIRFFPETKAYLIVDSIAFDSEAKRWVISSIFPPKFAESIQAVKIRARYRKRKSFVLSRKTLQSTWQLENAPTRQVDSKAVQQVINQIATLQFEYIRTNEPVVWKSRTAHIVVITGFRGVEYYLLFSRRKTTDNLYQMRLYAQTNSADTSVKAQAKAFTARYKRKILVFPEWAVTPLLKKQSFYFQK